MEPVDKFFKEKMETHTITPSENAWTKVEAGISKKINIVLWRWAAAVLLMGALVSVILWSQRGAETNQPTLAKKAQNAPQPKVNPEVPSKTSTPILNEDKKERNSQQQAQPIKVTSEEIQKVQPVAMAKEPAKQQQIQVEQVNDKKIIEQKAVTEATTKTEVASTTQKPIKLEFTLEDLPSEETVATTNEAKPTGLMKVLNLAREIKQGEGPVGSLRDKKNELFAHNFIKGKERQ